MGQCVHCGMHGPIYVHACPQRYGFFNFIFDVFMVFVTGGLWLIWIFIREMRKN